MRSALPGRSAVAKPVSQGNYIYWPPPTTLQISICPIFQNLLALLSEFWKSGSHYCPFPLTRGLSSPMGRYYCQTTWGRVTASSSKTAFTSTYFLSVSRYSLFFNSSSISTLIWNLRGQIYLPQTCLETNITYNYITSTHFSWFLLATYNQPSSTLRVLSYYPSEHRGTASKFPFSSLSCLLFSHTRSDTSSS